MAFFDRFKHRDPDETMELERMRAVAPEKSTNLMTYSDTARVPEEVVLAVPEPSFTPTWHPIGHAKVIDALQHACNKINLNIIGRDYSLNVKGTRMFGVWDLDYRTNGSCYSLGFRNSIDKSMVVGVVGGFRVFVCDNLALSGEYLQFHKHTSGLDQDRLYQMADNALSGAWDDMKRLESWTSNLHNFDLNSKMFKEIIFDMMKARVFPPSQFERYLIAHEKERGKRVLSRDFTGTNLSSWYDKSTSLHTIHGGATRLMRNQSLFKIADSNKKLITVCDDYMEMAA